jgi:S-adenosyl-L-methionine hydrolase (adenosine-forming)
MAPENDDPREHAGLNWRPSGVVTLLTDFGSADTYVGVIKGVLAARSPLARVIDLTHAVPPQDVRAAAGHLRGAWTWFPRGSVHMCIVDPGVGSGRRILVGEQNGHAFLAPDNGLLSGVLDAEAPLRVLDLSRLVLGPVSRTFHGRDLFVPAAARLLRGRAPEELGPLVDDALRLEWPHPERTAGGGWRAEVTHVDHFGNLRTCLTSAELSAAQAAGWSARAGDAHLPLRGTYSEVEPGAGLALLDSSSFWEVAVRDGSAARELGLAAGARVDFEPPTAPAKRGAR